MDGTVLARRARELLPDLPVVYVFGRVNILDPRVRVPRSIFVPKPYVPALIGRVLGNAVKSATARAGVNGYCVSAPRARNSSSQWMW